MWGGACQPLVIFSSSSQYITWFYVCLCLMMPWVCIGLRAQSVQLFVAHQAPLSVEFFKQEYWSGLPFSSPGHLPDPGIKPKSPGSAGTLFTTKPPSWQRELALTEGGIEVMRDSKATQVLWAHTPIPDFRSLSTAPLCLLC